MKTRLLSGLLIAVGFTATTASPATTMTIHTDQPGARINPAMWGVFFEDINFGADGGLCTELIKNRSFEFSDAMMGWKLVQRPGARGTCTIAVNDPLNRQNPHYLQVHLDNPGEGFGLENEGFRGMGVKEGAKYTFSVFARIHEGSSMSLLAEVVAQDGKTIGSAKMQGFGASWRSQSVSLQANATEPKARLRVLVGGHGDLDLDMVSLFPQDTWKGRPGGLRADVVQMLANLRPGFIRFPGGCIVEGRTLPLRYQWKTTIGAPEERRLIINRWNDEFKHRPAPDYFQSFGLGFFEYFQLCEDLGAQPLPILNCGMACQFNSGELTPLSQLDPFVQDALDLIEFANGAVTTPWGSRRTALGHPAPFGLKLLGIGNEQWGPQYVERYERFASLLKTRHPQVQLVVSAGPDPDGEKFDFLWPKWRALRADLVDEHYYRPPVWFLDNTHRYDGYDRQAPKVFAGEYAAQSVRTVSVDNRNNWECALAEAAMMTGFERNADVVRMASYAPLFGHMDAWQWTPNLIWFDNLRVYGTPNYYVQQMFSVNRGDRVIPLTLSNPPQAPNGQPRVVASATWDEKSSEVILKTVNATDTPATIDLHLTGAKTIRAVGTRILLSAASLKDENSLEQPRKVTPQAESWAVQNSSFSHTFAPYSFTLLRIGIDP